ncbi:MAG: hypothetical protein CVV47_10595 [Spirochaetae bacterium HGW-Spirochaetae-3]|jgi:hypothetical protein|nr:MAG: hypothetical protein CVV47_10595 [Spirochaetae bacterium HGW-Spirochaetae-3]
MTVRRARFPTLPIAFCIVASLAAAAPGTARADDEGIRAMARSGGTGKAADQSSFAAALARTASLDAILLAPDGVDIVEAASKASCALAIEATSETLPSGDARSSWRVLDPLTGETLSSGVVEGPEPTERDLAEFWWIAVADAAEAALPRVKKTLVRIEGAPGTRITGQAGKDRGGLGETDLVIPEEGFLEVPLRVPGTYPWRATSKGAYPERGYFGALEQGVSLTIPRSPLRRWTVEAGLYMTQFLDVWGAWRFAEDYLYVRFGLTQFLAGLYLVGEEYGVETPSAIISLPLVQPGIGFGGYFLAPDAYVRPYATGTFFARVLVASWAPLRFDPVAPIGTSGMLGAEWGVTPRVAVFLELGAAFYPFCDGFLMAASAGTDRSGPVGTAFGDGWFLEAPILRFGARLTL